MFSKIGSQDIFHGHLQDCSESNYQRDLLWDEMMGLYYVILGVQVETVLLVKVTGVFEFGLYHWETTYVCQMGDRMRMDQSSSEVLFHVVSAVYWSGFYSDGCGMDRTAQGCWKMLIACDKDNAELRKKSVAGKFVIKWVGFIFFKMNLLSRELFPPELMFPLSPNSCKNEKDSLSIVNVCSFVWGFLHASVLFQVWSLCYLFVHEKGRWVTARKECVSVMIPDSQP